MKCPKCGYNSFEGNDTCKKCSHDLTAHRLAYGLKPVVLQKEVRASMAAALVSEGAPSAVASLQPGPETDTFSFDLPPEQPAAPPPESPFADDVFSFDEPPPPAPSPFSTTPGGEQAAAAHDPFADLLEPTRVGGGTDTPAEKNGPAPGAPETGRGDYDLSDFSWDDTPESATADIKKPADDFDNLFGKVDEPAKK